MSQKMSQSIPSKMTQVTGSQVTVQNYDLEAQLNKQTIDIQYSKTTYYLLLKQVFHFLLVLTVLGEVKIWNNILLKSKIGFKKPFTYYHLFQNNFQYRENKPLIIVGKDGSGAKTLLINWLDHHQHLQRNKTYPDMLLSHFPSAGGTDANYGLCIYRILLKLRETLDICQKLELTEEKLRFYFPYWLSVCSAVIEKQIVNDSKIILIIPEIESFRDMKTLIYTPVDFWLPENFPCKIKVICSVKTGSQVHKYFQKIKCTELHLKFDQEIWENRIKQHLEKQLLVPKAQIDKITKWIEEKRNSQKNEKEEVDGQIMLSNFLLAYQLGAPYVDTKIVSNMKKKIFEIVYRDFEMPDKLIDNGEQMIQFFLKFFQGKIFQPANPKKFYKMFILLCITNKGLTQREICSMCEMQNEEWQIWLNIFKCHIIKYENLYKIISKQFKHAVLAINSDNNYFQIKNIHNEISEFLAPTSQYVESLRVLQEITYHQYQAKNHVKLKWFLTNLENFLVMYSPELKYHLCQYWHVLDGQFDPVIEYAKSMEVFEKRYKPSTKDLFTIFLQFSRFFKEFSDFETENTPDFRHPPILGYREVKNIGLYPEVDRMNMYWGEYKFIKIREEKEKQQRRMYYEYELDKQTWKMLSDEAQAKGKEFLEPQPLPPSFQSLDRNWQKQKILEDWEKQNVDIPTGRQKFRQHFQKLSQKYSQHKQSSNSVKLYNMLDDEEISEQQKQLLRREQRGITQSYFYKDKDLRSEKEKIFLQGLQKSTQKQNTDIKEEYKVKHYYYKRWLWMQFPYACISHHKVYSDIIHKIHESSTSYMSLTQEKEFTEESLQIVNQAKKAKSSVFDGPDKTPAESSQLTQQTTKKSKWSRLKSTLNIKPTIANVVQVVKRKNLGVNKSMSIGSKHYYFQNPSKCVQSSIGKKNKTFRKQKKQLNQFNINANFFITNSFLDFDTLNKLEKQYNFQKKLNQLPPLPQIDTKSKSTRNKNKRKIRMKANYKDLATSIKDDQRLSMALPSFKSQLNKHAVNQLTYLKNNNDEKIDWYNNLRYFNLSLAKSLKDLQVRGQQYDKLNKQNSAVKLEQKLLKLREKTKKTANQLKDIKSQEDRFNLIIKVCKNQLIHNAKWIKALNKLHKTYTKMIVYEKEEIARQKEINERMEKIKRQYFKTASQKSENHARLLKQLKQSLKEKQHIDHAIPKVEKRHERAKQKQLENLEWQEAEAFRESQQTQLTDTQAKKMMDWQLKTNPTYPLLQTFKALNPDGPFELAKRYAKFLYGLQKNKELSYLVQHKKQIVDAIKEKYYELQKKKEIMEIIRNNNKKAPPKSIKELQHLLKEAKREKFLQLLAYNKQATLLSKMNIGWNMMNKTMNKPEIIDSEELFQQQHLDDFVTTLQDREAAIKENLIEEEYKQFQQGTFNYSKIYISLPTVDRFKKNSKRGNDIIG